jgi:hypothetical protein
MATTTDIRELDVLEHLARRIDVLTMRTAELGKVVAELLEHLEEQPA